MIPMIRVVLANLFRKPATIAFPAAPKAKDPLVRGQIAVKADGCIFCGSCQRSCPAAAIRVDRSSKTLAINRFDCVICGECVAACPKKCLYMTPEASSPAGGKSEEVLIDA